MSLEDAIKECFDKDINLSFYRNTVTATRYMSTKQFGVTTSTVEEAVVKLNEKINNHYK